MAQHKRKGQPARGGGHGMFYVVLGVIALAGVAAIFYAVRGDGGSGTAATEPVAIDVTDARDLYDRATPHRLGPDEAPTKIVVFSDFMCPGCAAFGLSERARIMPWIERGEAQYVAYDYPLGGRFVHSFLAARAARCAEEQEVAGSAEGTGFWPFHDLLYQRQSAWSGQQSVIGTFIGYGQELGFDGRSFEQCIRSDRYADVVTANRMLGDQLGVTGTPTVLVNNRRISGRTIGDMGNAVLEILRESSGQESAAGQ